MKSQELYPLIIEFLLEIFRKKKYSNLDKILIIFRKLKYSGLALHLNAKEKTIILLISNYFGFKKAIWKGYGPIVSHFFRNIMCLMKQEKEKILEFHENMILYDYLNFLAFYDIELCKKNLEQYGNEYKAICEKIKKKIDILGF